MIHHRYWAERWCPSDGLTGYQQLLDDPVIEHCATSALRLLSHEDFGGGTIRSASPIIDRSGTYLCPLILEVYPCGGGKYSLAVIYSSSLRISNRYTSRRQITIQTEAGLYNPLSGS